LMEAISEFCPSVDVKKISKEDLEELVDSLGENIINYHPEDFHALDSIVCHRRPIC